MSSVRTNEHPFSIARLVAGSIFSAVLWSSSSFGLGIALPDQDAFATARGNAFVATANDPAAVFYNPAGISQLQGANVSLGAYGIVYGSTYKNFGTTIDSKTQLAVVPQFFSTYSLTNYNLSFGLGTYSPYGFRMEWPSTSLMAEQGFLGQISYYTLNAVVAYQVLPSLSVAAGPTINYSEVNLLEYPGPGVGLPFTYADHFRGRDWAEGYNLGVLWHPLDQHSFGVTYRSGTVMNYTGHGTQFEPPVFPNGPASAKFHFPQTVDFGYSFRPTPKWNIEADGDWSDWSGLKDITVQGQPAPLAFNWQASWIASVGVTRYLGDGWRLSGGYMYSENSVPSEDFSALVPDSDRNIFSIGIGKTYGHFSWDAAYQFAWAPSRSVSADAGYPTAAGNYEFMSHALTVNLGYHF